MFRASTPTSETEGAVVRVCTIPVTVCACTCIKVTRVILIFCCLILCSHATLNRRSRAAPGAHLGTLACTNLVHTSGDTRGRVRECGGGAGRGAAAPHCAHCAHPTATRNGKLHRPCAGNGKPCGKPKRARTHTRHSTHNVSSTGWRRPRSESCACFRRNRFIRLCDCVRPRAVHGPPRRCDLRQTAVSAVLGAARPL